MGDADRSPNAAIMQTDRGLLARIGQGGWFGARAAFRVSRRETVPGGGERSGSRAFAGAIERALPGRFKVLRCRMQVKATPCLDDLAGNIVSDQRR